MRNFGKRRRPIQMRWFQLRARVTRSSNIVRRNHAPCECGLYRGSVNWESGLGSDIHQCTHIADMHLGSQMVVSVDGA